MDRTPPPLQKNKTLQKASVARLKHKNSQPYGYLGNKLANNRLMQSVETLAPS